MNFKESVTNFLSRNDPKIFLKDKHKQCPLCKGTGLGNDEFCPQCEGLGFVDKTYLEKKYKK